MLAYGKSYRAIPMPLVTHEKGKRFHTCCLLGSSSALFAFSVCSKTNHRGRPAVLARGSVRLIRLLSLVLETSKIGRWQFMYYYA